MKIDVTVTSDVSNTARARQVEAMFDVPRSEKSTLTWQMDAPLHERPWSIGLITGPSGAGKSTIARSMFGDSYHPALTWDAKSVIDDFDPSNGVEAITQACASVGFNTIPAWLRPHRVLSNGEQFRVDLARRLLELPSPIVVDEFTSVVDRQVAKIGSHAVAKLVRRSNKQFVAVSCHDDIIDWLQPDWVLCPAERTFRWRSVQPRPTIDVELRAAPRRLWQLFAPFHYMTAELPGGQYYALFVEGRPVAFASVSKMPHPKTKNLWRFPRVVTLPDWQGLGLIWQIINRLAAAWRGVGQRIRMTPAHPPFIRGFQRSTVWKQERQAGRAATPAGRTRSTGGLNAKVAGLARTNAIFEYVGPAMERADALRIFTARA
jgi:ABC-type nitrate/sulfonate/bicarbonate transport system ATPase subunit